jgi:HD-GYP domain-containing protein (c-di-GMP phosphodiesterase class II)
MSRTDQAAIGPTWEESLFQALYRMIQTIRIHQDNNELVAICLHEFQKSISKLDLEEDLTIQVSEGRFYVQGERLQFRKHIVRLIHAMLDFFGQRALRGLRFHPDVKEVPNSELLAFVRLLIRSAEKEDPTAWLDEQIQKFFSSWANIIKAEEGKKKRVDKNLRKKAKTTYFQALSSVKDVAQKFSAQGYADVRKAKRMVQNMVDCVGEDESILLALSAIKEYDDYTYSHSVNVAVLALCLGNRIGLSRNSLEHLGICGLFHDLGKVEIPRDIINKPGGLTEEEREEVQKHPLSSVKQILKLHAAHDIKSKILLGPFEHHIKYDLTGYPQLLFKKNVSLFGRILQIADVYDAITSPRAYRASSLSPDQALVSMLERAGTDFDPILMKVFALMMGTYPVGTLLQFDTGELGLVIDYLPDSARTKPRIILLEEGGDGNLRPGNVVELHEKQPGTGAFKRNVVKSLNPASLGIRIVDFLSQ